MYKNVLPGHGLRSHCEVSEDVPTHISPPLVGAGLSQDLAGRSRVITRSRSSPRTTAASDVTRSPVGPPKPYSVHLLTKCKKIK